MLIQNEYPVKNNWIKGKKENKKEKGNLIIIDIYFQINFKIERDKSLTEIKSGKVL